MSANDMINFVSNFVISKTKGNSWTKHIEQNVMTHRRIKSQIKSKIANWLSFFGVFFRDIS